MKIVGSPFEVWEIFPDKMEALKDGSIPVCEDHLYEYKKVPEFFTFNN